jgi:hypothetical protein
MDVALIICKCGWYTTYRTRDNKTWPLSIAEIVSARSIKFVKFARVGRCGSG